jgi:hypothetical protein
LLSGLVVLLLGTLPAAAVMPVPEVELAEPEVAIEWAWIVPGPEGRGEQLVPAEPAVSAAPPALPEAEIATERLGTVRFRYLGERPTDVLRITVTLPAGLDYVPDSATGPGAETQYAETERRLRWTLSGPIVPGTAGLVSFRARASEMAEGGETP